MEFESTLKRQVHSYVCVVYDPSDGRIVHGRTVVGDGKTGEFGPEGRDDRERATLEGAQRMHGDVSKLRLLHVPPDFRFAPGTGYRVDVQAGSLVEAPVRERTRRPGLTPPR